MSMVFFNLLWIYLNIYVHIRNRSVHNINGVHLIVVHRHHESMVGCSVAIR